MIIGVPKEIKDNEFRVALVPGGARTLTDLGHEVVVERSAGVGSAIDDDEFAKAGARIVETAGEVFEVADVIVKVKEPQPSEFGFLKARGKELTLFTFLHLASGPALFEALKKSGTAAIAYETVEEEGGATPLLRPMSAVAGRLSVQEGARFLTRPEGGRGVLLGGVPGVEPGKVLIIGAGVVGMNALQMAVGLGANVTVINKGEAKLAHIDDLYGGRVRTLLSSALNIEKSVKESDLLIGAVHIPGAKTAQLVTKEMVASMRKGSVIVDVAIDQGGSVETIRPTTHSDPVYEEFGVIHYAVTNMPGAVPRTSTFALTNATLPFLVNIVELGLKGAIEADPLIASGLNLFDGRVTNREVASLYNEEYFDPSSLF